MASMVAVSGAVVPSSASARVAAANARSDARAAAGHVLANLDDEEPTWEFVGQLLEASPRTQVDVNSSLMDRVSRTAVESADMATTRVGIVYSSRTYSDELMHPTSANATRAGQDAYQLPFDVDQLDRHLIAG
jgi:hypothetical protein